jgi:hypothetical protein
MLNKKQMKKFLLIGSLFVSAQCFSQGLLSRLSFGLKAGANYSNYTNANFKTNAILGFHAGAIVDFHLIGGLSIQEEFLFSSQGAKVKDDVFNKQDINVYYVTVPFLFKYRTPTGIYVEAGPQVGMRVKDFKDTTQIRNFARNLDLAAAAGIGYQSCNGLGFGLRYVAGISKVGDFNLANVNPDFKTSVVQASIFYIF